MERDSITIPFDKSVLSFNEEKRKTIQEKSKQIQDILLAGEFTIEEINAILYSVETCIETTIRNYKLLGNGIREKIEWGKF